ncbi:DNA polymerase III subunit gamma/tau [Niabella terrae]
MDKFLVSARKYRPQLFDTVVGQSHITTTLKNAIKQEQLAHAFLFCGPRGVGKTTCARILAKTINCERPSAEGEACNECNSCNAFNQGNSLNIHELDAASNNSVDDIRVLVDQVRFTPQAGKYKVYIIDEVHMLTAQAFNAFLKTLEEPPPFAIFILATTEKHKILPTILSRCQIFDFKRITPDDTVEHLQAICTKEGVQAEKASLQLIAQKSEGCMRDALSIMDKIVSFSNGELSYAHTLEHLNILDEDYYFKFMELMRAQDLSGALLLFDDINRKGFEGDMVLNGMAAFIRNLLVCRDQQAAVLLDTVERFKTKYLSVAEQLPPAYLLSALNLLSQAEINYRTARNKRLHVELALIKLCYLQQALQLSSDDTAVIKKKIAEKTGALPFRNIRPIAVKTTAPDTTTTGGARLTIQQEKKQVTKTASASEVPDKIPEPATAKTKPNTGGKISSLEKLRKQFHEKVEDIADQPLVADQLQEAWEAFARHLKENKNSAAQSFEMARLQIMDANSFVVNTSSIIEHRFVDFNKVEASEFLQKRLRNSQLQFVITTTVQSTPAAEGTAPLTSVQQYQELIAKYPLVREFKEQLKLELNR